MRPLAELVEAALLGQEPHTARAGWHVHSRACSVCQLAIDNAKVLTGDGPRTRLLWETGCLAGTTLLKIGWDLNGVAL